MATQMRGVGLAVVLSVAFLLVAAPWAAASTYYWDNNSNGPPWGGAGTWNTTTSYWAASTTSPYGFTTWSPNTTSNGNTAVFQGTAGAVSLSGTIYANALQFDVSGYTIQSGTLYLSQSSPTITVTNSSHTATISSVVTGSAGLKKSGSGTLILSGANSYLNTTTISAGTLSVSNVVVSGGGTSGLGNSTTAVVLGGTTAKGTLNYTGAAATYTRGFTIGTGGGELDNNGSGLLTVSTGNVTNTTNGAFTVGGSGDVTINSVIGAGSGTLTKTGAGTLTLTNTNTYTGTTTVSQGKLLVNGSTHASSAVSVASGATLGGSGTIGGATTINSGGRLAPGASVGNLTMASLTLASGAFGDFEFNTGSPYTHDLAAVTGTLTLSSGTINVNLYNVGTTTAFTTDGTYHLFSYGTLSGETSNLSVVDASKPYSFTTSASGGINYLDVIIGNLNASNLTIPGTATLRMMKNGSGTPGSATISNTSAADAGDYTVTGTAGTDALTLSAAGGTVAASGTAPLGFGWASTAATGSRSGTITLTNTSNASDTIKTTSVTGAVVDKRSVSNTSGTVSFKALVGTAVSQGVNFSSSGLLAVTTSVQLAAGASADGNGVSLSGTATDFLGASDTQTTSRTVGGTFATSGTKNGSLDLAVTTLENGGGGLAGEGAYASVSVPYTAQIYQPIDLNPSMDGAQLQLSNAAATDGGQRATAKLLSKDLAGDASWSVGGFIPNDTVVAGDTTNSAGAATFTSAGKMNHPTKTYDATYTVTVGYADTDIVGGAPEDVFWNLSATVTGNVGTLTASVAAGEDYDGYYAVSDASLGSTATLLQGTAAAPRTLSVSWRDPDTGGPLISDVGNLGGTGSDIFALSMNYDPDLLTGEEEELALIGEIYLGWYDTGASQWVNAIDGNTGGPGGQATPNFQGGFQAYTSGLASFTMSDILGAWGVDTANHEVWAVVDHNSEFGVTPEPATLVLLGLGGLGLILGRKRR